MAGCGSLWRFREAGLASKRGRSSACTDRVRLLRQRDAQGLSVVALRLVARAHYDALDSRGNLHAVKVARERLLGLVRMQQNPSPEQPPLPRHHFEGIG